MNRNYISLLLVFILTIGVGSYVYYTKAKSFDKKIEGLNFVTVKASTIIQISNPNQNLEELLTKEGEEERSTIMLLLKGKRCSIDNLN